MSAIQSITINSLQRLNGITIDFERKGVTAIMGANGSGKTTILQALACVYRKASQINIPHETLPYEEFFKPYQGQDWNGSSYSVNFYYRDNPINYSKNSNKWAPRAQNRTQRYTSYVSILDCAPHQEKENKKEILPFAKEELQEKQAKKKTLLRSVSGALNKEYADAGIGVKPDGLKQFLYAKTIHQDGTELEYPSHYMGAGEQKVIYLMNEVIKAPNNSLILIEELDISLHESAIRSLINFLCGEAESRNLQIVFTTHWLGIQEFFEKLNIVSLYEEPENKTIVLRDGFDPQFVHHLDGRYESLRQISVWTEDAFAGKILSYIAREKGVIQFLKIKNFGSIQNAYTVAAAMALFDDKLDRTVIVTDGDECLLLEEKQDQINHSLSGNGDLVERQRETALSLIVDLASPDESKPEKVILDFCRFCEGQPGFPAWLTDNLRWIDQQVPALEPKQAIYQLSQHTGIAKGQLEDSLIQEATKAIGWEQYVAPFVAKLNEVVVNIGLPAIKEEEVA
jgi:AAA15 family ATPase/GTPase